MSYLTFRRFALLGALLALAPLAVRPAGAQALDPVGDTFGTGPVQLDISSTSAVLMGSSIEFHVTYTGPIAPPSAFAPNSVVGFIDIDTDQNGATGGTAPWGGPLTGGNNWINSFIPPNPGSPAIPGPLVSLGDEYYIDLGSELSHPGLVDILRTSDNSVVGTKPITYGATFFDVFVDLSLLGNDDGALNYGLLTGTFNESTDRAPNGATGLSSTSAVPEPGTLALLAGFGVVGIGLLRRRRK
jgi:hypothetical protein